MIDRPSGAYIEDANGNIEPDMNDQAMAARAKREDEPNIKEENDNAQNQGTLTGKD